MNARKLTRMALIGAVYATLTLLPPLAGIAYGPVQVRVAEALTVLPFLTPVAIPGLYVGCFIANLGSPVPGFDLTLGAFSTLVAAVLTRRMPRAYLAPLPPVVVNALLVSTYVSQMFNWPYWLTVIYIGTGQLIACYGLGYPLLLYLQRRRDLLEWLNPQ